MNIQRYFPILDWGRRYSRGTLASDLLAAVIVTVLLIPQSLAYALLAGLPAQVGLYASILPLVAYAVFGTSRVLAVGPVAVVSLMTAAAVGTVAVQGTPEYLVAAIALAMISGLMLLGLGLLRLGFLANFLSHPVISGFISASGLIIAASQLKHVLGIPVSGHNLLEISQSVLANLGQANVYSTLIGISCVSVLLWMRSGFKTVLVRCGTRAQHADVIAKAAPVAVVGLSIVAVYYFGLHGRGVAIVGEIPQALPSLTIPDFDASLWRALLPAAALISVIGFVESVSVAQTLAARRRQRIDPDQELVGLGAANVASAMSGGFPVTGGFARSIVNFDAGAATPAAGLFTALGIALAALYLTPLLYFLPNAALAATIIVAVIALVDPGALRRTWRYSRSDFSAMAATMLLTLALGVEAGLLTGVGLSLMLHLYRTSRPHCAVVGLVPGTQHFRNVERHAVITSADVATLRVDESLYFANARFLEDRLSQLIAAQPTLKHVILMCSAVNEIDASALESLEAINHRLKAAAVGFHLSEVKGPVMDRLQETHFLAELNGQVFLSQYEGFTTLAPDNAGKATNGPHTNKQSSAS